MLSFIIEKIEELTFSEVTSDESLWESKILDSITIVELAAEIEDQYNIKIPFDDIIVENFETASRIESYIIKKIG